LSRNHLKNFPTAMLRRGLAHYRPVSTPNAVAKPAGRPVQAESGGSRLPEVLPVPVAEMTPEPPRS
jgi:hypothetical protein